MASTFLRAAASLGLLADAAAQAAPVPVNLTVDYLPSPLGVPTLTPRFSWQLDHILGLRNVTQTAYSLSVSSTGAACTAGKGDVWASGAVASTQSQLVPYAGTTALIPGQTYYWSVQLWTSNAPGTPTAVSACSRFSIGLQSADDWDGSSAFIGQASTGIDAAPWFRTNFTVTAEALAAVQAGTATAYLHVASIGYHEAYLNGGRVEPESVLLPSVANLGKVVPSHTYDVASFLAVGPNVLGLWLGPGWANFSSGVNFNLTKAPLVRAELRITPAVGAASGAAPLLLLVSTNSSWKVSRSTTSHIGTWQAHNFGGDRVDYTAVPPGYYTANGWATLAVDASAWEGATEYDPQRLIRPEHLEATGVLGTVPVSTVVQTACPNGTIPAPGTSCYLVTFTELFTGWFTITSIPATPGAVVTIYYTTNNGTLVEYNMIDEVLLSAAEQGYQNRFSYHEIQYVTLTNLTDLPQASSMTGLRLMSARPRYGSFSSSNLLLNTIYDNTIRTYEGLTTGGMTVDCPHRERLGYGGDAHTSMELAMVTWESGAFFTKIGLDWGDVQGWDGTTDLPHTAPTLSGGGGPAWGGYLVLMPWEWYQRSGDTRQLAAAWPHVIGFLDFLLSNVNATNGLMEPFGGGWGFLGDWITPHGSEASGSKASVLFNNAYLTHCLNTAVQIANLFGDSAHAQSYAAAAASVGAGTHSMFFNTSTATYLDHRQTHQLMPLVAGLVPTALQPTIMQAFINSIVVNASGHFDTGLHGTYFISKFLTDLSVGRDDLMYLMLTQETAPGYGDMISKGYITWPEYWGGSGSRMHGCLNGIGLWFPQGALGVRSDPANPGFQSAIVKPAYGVGNLTWAQGTVHTLYGDITVAWTVNYDGGAGGSTQYTLALSVPGNARATVWIPASSPAAVTESGVPAAQAPGVAYVGTGGPAAEFTLWAVGSGSYAFASSL